jgi:hypothetical protein
MATQAEYIAVAAALGEFAQEQLAQIPDRIRPLVMEHIDMEQIGEKVNAAAVKAVDTLDAFRAKETAAKPAS